MMLIDAAVPDPTHRIPVLPKRGRISWFEIALLLASVGLVVSGLAPSLQDVVLLSFLFGGLALAWNIAGGYAGLISFGHSAFFGVGAYTSTILAVRYGVTPWIGIWIGALIGGICVGVVQSLSSYYVAPAFGQMFFFILFLLVMIFRPNGLLGQQGAATIGMNE